MSGPPVSANIQQSDICQSDRFQAILAARFLGNYKLITENYVLRPLFFPGIYFSVLLRHTSISTILREKLGVISSWSHDFCNFSYTQRQSEFMVLFFFCLDVLCNVGANVVHSKIHWLCKCHFVFAPCFFRSFHVLTDIYTL